MSLPFITAADPLPQTTTSFVNTSVPVVNSQVISTPVVVTAPQVSYVPQVSMVPQAVAPVIPPQKSISTGVKVVPIYDDF